MEKYALNYPPLVLASRNQHKLIELQKLFGIPQDSLRLATDYPGSPDVEENGTTFEENALIKARALRDFTGEWAVGDDSGLEVDSLGGEPGIYSARYAGQHGDDKANNLLLLQKMAPLSTPRTAHFTCAIALVSPDGREFVTMGHCPGTILHQGRGNNGFGYDPLFLPDGYNRTFAELPSDVKCSFSHRAIAAAKMCETMKNIFTR